MIKFNFKKAILNNQSFLVAFFPKGKKCISPVVATSLLLVVAVVAVVSFQGWYQTFSSNLFVDIEQQSSIGNLDTGIEAVVGESLYFKAGSSTTISSVKIDGIDCPGLNGTYSGMQNLNVSECLEEVTASRVEVVVYTNQGVNSKNLFLSQNLGVSFASCSLGGITLQHGENYSYYLESLPSGTSCESEVRVCTNGIFDGNNSYTQSSCLAGCSQSGINLASADNYTFFQTEEVQFGEVCTSTSEVRVCTNGSLSGSYEYSACSIAGQITTPNAFSFTNLTGVEFSTFYTSETITPSGFNGEVNLGVSGSGNPQLSINGGSWSSSGQISLGDNLTLRLNSSSSGLTSNIVNLTFGPNYNVTWSVTTRAFNNCAVVDGVQLNHSESSLFYLESLPSGTNCSLMSETRTCTDGVLSGSYTQSSCLSGCVGPGSDLFRSGEDNLYYLLGVVPYGSSCSSETRVCTNGVLSGSYEFDSCSVTPQDTMPNSFSFTNQNSVNLNILRTSNTLTPSGYDGPLSVSISGSGSPQLRINSGSWVSSGSMNPGDTLTIRLTSANTYDTLRQATLTLGGFSTTWGVETRSPQPSLLCNTDSDGDGFIDYLCANYPMEITTLEGYLDPNDSNSSVIPRVECVWNNNRSACESYFEVDGCGTDTVLDTSTGLCWDRNFDRDGTKTWTNAISYCDGLTTHPSGHSDWYLPTRQEFETIVDLTRTVPHIVGGNSIFQNVENSWYWTKTTYGQSTSIAFTVFLNNGYSTGYDKTNNGYVACVRRN